MVDPTFERWVILGHSMSFYRHSFCAEWYVKVFDKMGLSEDYLHLMTIEEKKIEKMVLAMQ